MNEQPEEPEIEKDVCEPLESKLKGESCDERAWRIVRMLAQGVDPCILKVVAQHLLAWKDNGSDSTA
jgi:ferritin-like protein